MERKTESLQGINIDTLKLDEAVEYAFENRGQVVTLNPEMVMSANKNKDFKNIIQNAQLVIPDGIGVKIGLKILGKKNIHRIAGIEFAYSMIKKFASEKLPVALIGAKQEVIETACNNLKKEFSGLNIVYSQNGYFTDKEKVKADLVNSGAKLVLVALGSPKQEEFIFEIKSHMPETLFIGVGGSFDVWAGLVRRAPEIWQKTGFEWLYRTLKEPSRFKRIFPVLPMFVLKVLKERIFGC
ncbi:WecB/TagA/CpsF family glycosyltransferase [bacterium]|nr:WecB/TagA/CpsF family glycosyltransferase [bacterium]